MINRAHTGMVTANVYVHCPTLISPLTGHYGSTGGTKLQEVGTDLLEDVDESVSSWEPDGMATGKGKSDREISPSFQKAGRTHQLLECRLLGGTLSVFSLPHMGYQADGESDRVCIWLHTHTHIPGCSAAIVWARARLLPPTWSSTASTNLLHVGFPNLSTWEEEEEGRHIMYTTLPSLCTFEFFKFDTVQSTITISIDKGLDRLMQATG